MPLLLHSLHSIVYFLNLQSSPRLVPALTHRDPFLEPMGEPSTPSSPPFSLPRLQASMIGFCTPCGSTARWTDVSLFYFHPVQTVHSGRQWQNLLCCVNHQIVKASHVYYQNTTTLQHYRTTEQCLLPRTLRLVVAGRVRVGLLQVSRLQGATTV